MTTVGLAEATPVPVPAGSGRPDHRGSWIPNGAMIATRFMELRRRRGLMIALLVVTIGLPSLFLVVRLLAHAFDPTSYGPAGGYQIYAGLVAGVLYVFGFIVAATLGCTAGSVDLTEGMFRHLVITGRSRLALYLARIPAGLGIIVPLVAAGFTIVCVVCVFAAPTTLNYDGVTVPPNLSVAGLEHWAAAHPDEVLCDFNTNGPPPANVPCGGGPVIVHNGHVIKGVFPGAPAAVSHAQLLRLAESTARLNYHDYHKVFLYPSVPLMIRSGLWVELEAIIGFIVGLGLASLLGQRTVAVVLMVVLEIVLTPIFGRVTIPHLINAQRAVVGVATDHLEPAGLAFVFGGGGGPGGNNGTSLLVPETRLVAALVIVAWLVGWTAIGAWRMVTRDA